MKKSKIVDLVLFYDEIEILNRRIQYLSGIVDLTIIVNYGNTIIKNYGDNVIEIKLNTDFKLNNNTIFNSIIEIFGDKFFKYSDKFIFSKVFEIPNITNIMDELSKIESFPNFIFHKKLMWGQDNKTIFDYPGVVLFKYGEFQVNPKILDYYDRCKINLNNMTITGSSGWNIQTFQDDEKLHKGIEFYGDSSISLNLLKWYKESGYDFMFPSYRVENNYEVNLPDIFKDLQQKNIVRNPVKVFITNDFDMVNKSEDDFRIFFTDSNIQTTDFIVHNPKTPTRVLYGDKNYDDFKLDYKLNELLFLLKNLNLIDEDEIHIKIKSESLDSDFKRNYGEFRKSIPSELIKIYSSFGTSPK
jgi:hypothetical protein